MSDEAGALDAAIGRLDRALSQLEISVTAAIRRPDLSAELDAARQRERELQAAGSEAAQALGRAIEEIRAALGEDQAAAILNGEN